MKYDYNTRRYVLDEIIEGQKAGETFQETTRKIKWIDGSKLEKEQLFKDCQAYIEIKWLAESDNTHQYSVTYAKQYLIKNPESILIKEALLTIYIRDNQLEEAEKLCKEILGQESDNHKTISKMITILLKQRKYEELETFIGEKREIVKKDLVIFNQLMKYYVSVNKPENMRSLIENVIEEVGREKGIKEIKKNKRNLNNIRIFLQEFLNESQNMPDEKKECYEEIIDYICIGIKKTQSQVDRRENYPFVCEKIDHIIATLREETEIEDLYRMTEEINDDILKSIQQCQIGKSYGLRNEEILYKITNFCRSKDVNFPVEVKREITILKNYLSGTNSKAYIHDDWIRMKENYLKRIDVDTRDKKYKGRKIENLH